MRRAARGIGTGPSTAGCSICVVTMCSPLSASAENVPLIARLFASLPPLVNTISSGAQRSRLATCRRAFSSALLAGMLAQCPLDGLPNASSRNGRIAAATAGSIGRARVVVEIDHGSLCSFITKPTTSAGDERHNSNRHDRPAQSEEIRNEPGAKRADGVAEVAPESVHAERACAPARVCDIRNHGEQARDRPSPYQRRAAGCR